MKANVCSVQVKDYEDYYEDYLRSTCYVSYIFYYFLRFIYLFWSYGISSSVSLDESSSRGR